MTTLWLRLTRARARRLRMIITDGLLIREMQRAIWRDEARHAGVAEEDIERAAFWKWRMEQVPGGVAAVVRGGGRDG